MLRVSPPAVGSLLNTAGGRKRKTEGSVPRWTLQPTGVAATAAAGFLIADLGDHRVRVVDAVEDVAYIPGTSANDNGMF